MRRDNQQGYSLLEAVVSLVLFLVIFLSALMLLDGFQVVARNMTLLREKEANLTTAPLLLARWVTPAGNNRYSANWAGVSGDAGRLDIRSDLDGSGGFPDGAFSQSYESIAIRGNGSEMQLRSDKGSFQPVLKNIGKLEFQIAGLPLVEAILAPSFDRPFLRWKKPPAENETRIGFYVWNYRQNLFAEAP